MGVFDQLAEMLKPHADRASSEFAFHMAALHTRLSAIERATLDAARGDIGDHWQRFQIRKKLTAETLEPIGECPMNELWMIQAISSDGAQEKSPAFVLEANGVLLESVVKEGLGFEGIGGNQVVLPGESLTIKARETGSVNCTITIIRRTLPGNKVMADMGKSTEVHSPRQLHDNSRDEIAQRIPALYGARDEKATATEGLLNQALGMTVRQ